MLCSILMFGLYALTAVLVGYSLEARLSRKYPDSDDTFAQTAEAGAENESLKTVNRSW